MSETMNVLSGLNDPLVNGLEKENITEENPLYEGGINGIYSIIA